MAAQSPGGPSPGGPSPGETGKGRASLVGGIVVGIAVLVLWGMIARELGLVSTATTIAGLLAAIAVAAWIRLADL